MDDFEAARLGYDQFFSNCDSPLCEDFLPLLWRLDALVELPIISSEIDAILRKR